MATDSKYKVPFHIRLFIYLFCLLSLFFLSFVFFQYSREKRFKAEKINYELQEVNINFYHHLQCNEPPESFNFSDFSHLTDKIRISIIDLDGRVLYDSGTTIPLDSIKNHKERPEVQKAIIEGEGYTIHRVSETTKIEYFYSAKRFGSVIIRSAIPYSLTLNEMLSADKSFFWFIFMFALAISSSIFFLTRRLGQNITRLREFADRAERGRPIEGSLITFQKDELGEISNQIVNLYKKLQQTQEALSTEHNRAQLQEQEQIRIKKQLTQNINHELKTPVSSIQGYLETIINNPDLDDARKRVFIDKSYEQIIRLTNLLQDISIITRMDEGSNMIEKSHQNISELIEDVLKDEAVKIKTKGFEVVKNIPEGLIMNGNYSLLYSVFYNLIDNALAYSGGTVITLSLLEKRETEYLFSFADNGVGMGEEHLTRIFERFYRVDKGRSRKLGGTGLGLSIVKNAVILHGGVIKAQLCNPGLEFVFSFKIDIGNG